MTKQRILRLVGPVLGLALFAGALVVMQRELSAYRYADLVAQVRALPAARILLATVFAALSYAALTGYDALALRYVRHPLPHRRVALASFVGYTASHNLGFPLLTGAPLRYRLYSRWGVPGVEIAKLIAFSATTFWLGMLAVGGISFVLDPLETPDFLALPGTTLRPLGFVLLALLAGYLALTLLHERELTIRGIRFSLPAPRLALAQVAVSTLDWTMACAVLYALLPAGTVSYPTLLGIYALAQIAGVVSNIPGGAGVFESLILLFLTPELPAPAALGTLLVFRAIYYLLPLVVAALLLAAYEGRRLRGRISAVGPVAEWVSSAVPHIMAGVVFLGGAILLFSGATPAVGSRLRLVDRVLPLAVIELSHLLASMVGVALLLLARGLQRRVNAAFHFTAALLAAGIVLSLLKGLDYEEATALAVVLGGLWLCRKEFYRPAALLEERFTPRWIVAVAITLGAAVWLGFFTYKHVEYSEALWWRFAPWANAPRFLRATVGGMVLLGAVGIARLLRPSQPRAALPGDTELERARSIIARSPRTTANLALTGDKMLLFSERGNAFLMYRIEGRSWITMGDPVGPPEEQRELAWHFKGLCEQRGAWPVFYQVSAESLPIYVDMGLTLSKLGEEARVPLPHFTLEGGSRKALRQMVRRVEREGVTFEIVPPEQVAPLLPELRRISDAWLAHHHTAEKRFSLGRFDERYLCRFPLALVRRGEEIVAFANVWSCTAGEELSVDLMRYGEAAPHGVMEYLFVQLMLWGQGQGYRWFNLGMAPLSGLEKRKAAPLWNQLGALLYRHGEHFYNFQGLRQYKEKFDPVWEPRYLASPGGLALPGIVTNVGALISGGLKGVVAR